MYIGGAKGYILAPGFDIPFAALPENIATITNIVHEDVTEIGVDNADCTIGLSTSKDTLFLYMKFICKERSS